MLFWRERVVVRVGEHRNASGEPWIAQRIDAVHTAGLGRCHLLLEERMQNNRRRSCILQAPHAVEMGTEWRGAGHERMTKPKPEVSRFGRGRLLPRRVGHGVLRRKSEPR